MIISILFVILTAIAFFIKTPKLQKVWVASFFICLYLFGLRGKVSPPFISYDLFTNVATNSTKYSRFVGKTADGQQIYMDRRCFKPLFSTNLERLAAKAEKSLPEERNAIAQTIISKLKKCDQSHFGNGPGNLLYKFTLERQTGHSWVEPRSSQIASLELQDVRARVVEGKSVSELKVLQSWSL